MEGRWKEAGIVIGDTGGVGRGRWSGVWRGRARGRGRRTAIDISRSGRHVNCRLSGGWRHSGMGGETSCDRGQLL